VGYAFLRVEFYLKRASANKAQRLINNYLTGGGQGNLSVSPGTGYCHEHKGNQGPSSY